MNKHILLLFLLLAAGKVHAQLTIPGGGSNIITGNTTVTLKDMDLINNGALSLAAGTSTFLFTGTEDNNISGSGSIAFDKLEIAKTGSGKLLLSQSIDINGSIHFTSGMIDLNKRNIVLQSRALLIDESETSRITGTAGGYVQITLPLNTPSQVNPGNLGAVISSPENLGETIIRRGHVSQKASATADNSIGRYYDILPANSSASNVTVLPKFLQSELNGLTSNSLHTWKSTDNKNWTKMDFASDNKAGNYSGTKELTPLSRWTLPT